MADSIKAAHPYGSIMQRTCNIFQHHIMKSEYACHIDCAKCNTHLVTAVNEWMGVDSLFITPCHQFQRRPWKRYGRPLEPAGGWFEEWYVRCINVRAIAY